MNESLIVLRQTIESNVEKIFNFHNIHGDEFLVKNFTDGDILVCVGHEFDQDNSVKILSKSWQLIPNADFDGLKDGLNLFMIKGSAAGEVEIQCVKGKR